MYSLTADILAAVRAVGGEDDRVAGLEERLGDARSTPMSALREWCDECGFSELKLLEIVGQIIVAETHADLDATSVYGDFVACIPIVYARQHSVVALQPEGGVVPIVISDPATPTVVDHIAAMLRMPARICLAPRAAVQKAINEAYADQAADFDGVIPDVEDVGSSVDVDIVHDGDLLDTASRAPVVRLVNMIIFEAVKRNASDVHVQPFDQHTQVRYRIDGVLYDHMELPVHLLDETVSRIKVIGQMDIAEKRLAQDGRTTVTVGDRVIDLRISIIPTSYGERAVIRLLDKSSRLFELGELGMASADQRRFEQLIQRTHGIILVTGPTGSGKSTTLYAALQYLDCKEKNILTLEDPIEYQLPGISQMQVSQKKGMTFATGLRAVLRQDPDIVMVGEIRDEETARMAVQSSLTGHLVFSTLHTNNAAGAVSRLLDLGIEPYLVASSLIGSLAQRLVRIVCPDCTQDNSVSERDVGDYSLDPLCVGRAVKQACGCERCADTGYRGRKGVFELLVTDDTIRELIVARAKTSEIERCAVRSGMKTLRQDALRKLYDGETTLEELARVTHQDGLVEESQHVPV